MIQSEAILLQIITRQAGMLYHGYQDFYANGPYAQYLLEHRVAGSTSARMLRVAQPAGAFPDPPLPEFLVYLGQQGAERLSFDWGCGRWQGTWHAEDISIAPPDTGTDITVDQPHAFLALALPAAFVASAIESLAPGRGGHFGKLHVATFRNAAVARACKELWRQTSGDVRADKLAVDSLLFGLISALARGAHGGPQGALSNLAVKQISRVLDFVEDCIAEDLSLHDLARVANLSPMHFARQFRRATGLSPHQYVLRSRMARAQALLKLTRHAIVDIAQAVGFSSQSHMTAAFSRRLGMTPHRYRQVQQG